MGDVGDRAFRQHHAQIYRYLRNRTGSVERSEDLAQEVFLALAAALPRVDERKPVLAWLYAVAKRRLIDESRKGGQTPPDVAPLETVADVPATEVEYGNEVAQALRRASVRLAPHDRRLLGLRLIQGLSFHEIGAELSITEAAAKMRYVRGLRILRAALEEEGITS